MTDINRMLRGLNPEQLRAVTLGGDSGCAHGLILAGAGSGKTRVLSARIVWLLQQGLVAPAGILAVTFTNKAAREMAARLQVSLPVLTATTKGMWLGTFHGLCNRLLRAHYMMIGLPRNFQILDVPDQHSAIKRLLKQHQVDDQQHPPKQVQWFIASAKEEGLRPKDVPVNDPIARQRQELYQLYEDQCQRAGVVDFAELLLRSFELLQGHEALRLHYQQRFRHILVDEFQDTNRLQYAWLKLLCPPPTSAPGLVRQAHTNYLFAVGDDDQSIYAFRGARVGNMRDFAREYSIEAPIKLEENYRSSSNILNSANALIAHNRNRLGKNLRTSSGQGELVRVYGADSDVDEVGFVVREIKALQAQGQDLRNIAILYRSNAQSRALESALTSARIPYKVYGGLRFFERAEIKHALAYLRLLENPNDDTSFMRVINFPARGIGARSIEQLHHAASARGASLLDSITGVPGKAGAHFSAFAALLQELRAQCSQLPLRLAITRTLAASGLLEHYRLEKDGQERVENLEELVTTAEAFSQNEGLSPDAPALRWAERGDFDPHATLVDPDSGEALTPLAAFLSHAALEAGDIQAAEGQSAVQLMTVHAAKGLEFNVVFIVGLEEGLFPHENSLVNAQGLEEERRLMYVAITRARHCLYLSHAQTRRLHGQTRYHVPSRFFDELPQAALHWLGSMRGTVQAAQQRFAQPWAVTGSAPRHEGGGVTLASATTAMAPPSPGQFHVGQRLFHNKFGEGDVLAIEGQGEAGRIHIRFGRHGQKWLALGIAKLTPL